MDPTGLWYSAYNPSSGKISGENGIPATSGEISGENGIPAKEKDDWLIEIKSGLDHAKSNRESTKTENVMRRVRQPLRKLKPEHYAPEEFFFGLFQRSPYGAQENRGNQCKFTIVQAVLEELEYDNFDSLCSEVVPEPEKIQNLYYEPGRDSLNTKAIQQLLTLDAVFLASFLSTLFYPPFGERFKTVLFGADSIPVNIFNALMKDLFKVENQIPFSLLEQVLGIFVRKWEDPQGDLAKKILRVLQEQTMAILSDKLPGWSLSAIEKSMDRQKTFLKHISFNKCYNFVDCMHSMICLKPGSKQDGFRVNTNFKDCVHCMICHDAKQSKTAPGVVTKATFSDSASSMPCLRMKQGQKGLATKATSLTYEEISLPSAVQLQKAGIRFQGRKGNSLEIKFKSGLLSGTLYLPTLKIGDDTEAIWRNMVAYEDAQDCENDFINYLELMHDLVDSTNDVMVLKSGRLPVILIDTLGSSKTVENIFSNRVLQNCTRGQKSENWILLRRQIYDYYNRRERHMFLKLKETYLPSIPWIIILWIIIYLVALTILYIIVTIRIRYFVMYDDMP